VPDATVDRLVLVRLRPDETGAVHVTLHGACAGTMAKIGSANGTIDFASAESCVDTENVRAPATETPFDDDAVARASVQGSFVVNEPCDAPVSADGGAICVPGGLLRMGAEIVAELPGAFATTPERIATIGRFWMDKNEVTVRDMRAAIANGLALDSSMLQTNDLFLKDGTVDPAQAASGDPYAQLCTYSSATLGRDDYPVNCISWAGARAYCKMHGGDLPTEAQWEYAATTAGKPRKTRFPWGDDLATCDRAVFGRGVPGGSVLGVIGTCTAMGARPLPRSVTTADGHDGKPGDVTPLGIVNLGGSMTEWVKDSWLAYDDPCWAAAPLRDPTCWEENARFRPLRGGSWVDDNIGPSSLRLGQPASVGAFSPTATYAETVMVGFRCAYEVTP
jgi:formylglycine-generating enzyme required for sulfatase activity